MAVPFLPTPTQHSGRDHPAFSAYGRPGDRFENVGPGVDEWYASTDQGTSTWDLCEDCAPAHRKTPHQYENIQAYGFGSPNRDASQGTIYEPMGGPAVGGGVAHPDYVSEGYTCDECGTPLTGEMHHPSATRQDSRLASQQWGR